MALKVSNRTLISGDNLQLHCNACNSMQGTGDQAAFVAKLKQQGML